MDAGISHSIGALSGGLLAGGLGVSKAIDDFGDGAKTWKGMNTIQKWGQGFDLAGSSVGVIDAVAPELAPLSAVLGGVGAVLDLVGGEKQAKMKQAEASKNYASATGEEEISAPSVKGTVATTTGATSLQKVGGVAHSSSY